MIGNKMDKRNCPVCIFSSDCEMLVNTQLYANERSVN